MIPIYNIIVYIHVPYVFFLLFLWLVDIINYVCCLYLHFFKIEEYLRGGQLFLSPSSPYIRRPFPPDAPRTQYNYVGFRNDWREGHWVHNTCNGGFLLPPSPERLQEVVRKPFQSRPIVIQQSCQSCPNVVHKSCKSRTPLIQKSSTSYSVPHSPEH